MIFNFFHFKMSKRVTNYKMPANPAIGSCINALMGSETSLSIFSQLQLNVPYGLP
jgi:hypothetical protein